MDHREVLRARGASRGACASDIRRMVTVTRLDLTREAIPAAAYDLIFCRNVVIYFDRPMQERLFAQFAEALLPGGILVLGKVETLLGAARETPDARRCA